MTTASSFEIGRYFKGCVYNELCRIHGASVLCKRSFFRRHKTFKDGKTDIKDAPHPGQPRTAATKAFQYLQGVPKKACFSVLTEWISITWFKEL